MTTNNDRVINKSLKLAHEMALNAGKILLKYQKKINKLDVHVKEAQGVASTADLESEKYILKTIRKTFPQHCILSEEDAFFENDTEYTNAKKSEWCWVIDPLDGTTNFLNGIDYYSVCIGLLYKGQPVMGVVYRPVNGDIFWAVKGQGAFMKNLIQAPRKKKIYQKNLPKKLKQCILVTGFATEKGLPLEEEFVVFKKLLSNTRAVRRYGSAALDLCYVAQGVFDGYWERGLAPWDVSAAGIIAIEAGVKITDLNGKKFSPFAPTFLAARSPVHGRLKSLVKELKLAN